MNSPAHVLTCLDTLLDITRGIGWDGDFAHFKLRTDQALIFRNLISGGRVTLCIPYTLLPIVHFRVRLRFEETDGSSDNAVYEASKVVEVIQKNSVCKFDVNYDEIIAKANAATVALGSLELHDLICLTYAEAIQANAFITRSPKAFQDVIHSNHTIFNGFCTPIMDIGTFLEELNNPRATCD
jgi:hypothetical protein